MSRVLKIKDIKKTFRTHPTLYRHAGTSPDKYVGMRHITSQVDEQLIEEGRLDLVWDESLHRAINYEERLECQSKNYIPATVLALSKAGTSATAKPGVKDIGMVSMKEGSAKSRRKIKKGEKAEKTVYIQPKEEKVDEEIANIYVPEGKEKRNYIYVQEEALDRHRLQRIGIPSTRSDLSGDESDVDVWINRLKQKKIIRYET